MTDKLSLYNGALGHCGSRPLASLAEAREARRKLDWAWARGIVDRCLQAGQWDFAARSVLVDISPSVSPQFGYQYAFDRPDDLIRTLAVCSDEYFKSPLKEYQQEGDYWYADIEPLYVRYVSNDTDYGGDYAKWPPNFVAYVELLLASEVCETLTASRTLKIDLLKLADDQLGNAKNTEAAEGPTQRPPAGGWSRARHGGTNGSDRGSTNTLMG